MEVLENIAAVELSRIAGYKYPDDYVELKQLQLLFATPLHIAAGDIVYTAPVNEPYDHVTKSGTFDSTELGFNYYFVKYIKLEINSSTTINEATKSNTSNMNSGNPDETNYGAQLITSKHKKKRKGYREKCSHPSGKNKSLFIGFKLDVQR
jgi:hypothetical protein